ncbi:hypothetical protein GCM10007938_15770 [Vibrio zhanjiangensis]|uniref:Tox-PLDMTX domain-containing protein n=1 Tax=Vibrio zhanjiangensis TaxID=1046128 RepID=A0ABQ6EXU5_9VIBR|nr:M91 family zinc metallopeptidase [Vibrio zhanjiangensis]GLT17799.1 hypothetical protein GCM10007938_15770 [Vibrio zhanjiangensis]
MPAASKAFLGPTQPVMSAESPPLLQGDNKLEVTTIQGDNKLEVTAIKPASEKKHHKMPSFERPNVTDGKIKLSEKKECGESDLDTVFPLRRSNGVDSVYGEIEKECGVGLKEHPLRRFDVAVDLPKQSLVEALKDKQQEAIEFIEKGYNELIIEIDKGLVPSLRERIAEIRSNRDFQASNLGPSEETLKGIERFLDKIKDKASVNSDDRGLAYQFARHVKISIQAVDEALKLGQMNASIGSLSQWEVKTTDEFLHSDDFFKNHKGKFEPKLAMDKLCSSSGQKLMAQHLVKQRTEVMKTLTANNNQLCNLYVKLDRYDKDVLGTDYFSMPRDIIGDIQSLVHKSANEFRGKAGVFNKPKDAWEYKPSYVTQKPPLKETVSRFFVDSSGKTREAFKSLTGTVAEKVKGLPSSTLGVLQELPKQAELASYALNHWRDVGHKKARKVGFDRISAPAGLKAEELKVKSIVRSMYWLMQQPALRMQYDLNPLQAAATNLKKDKPLEADFAAEAMKDLAQAVIDDFSTGKASGKEQTSSDSKKDKAGQIKEFNQVCDNALEISKDIEEQIANLPSALQELVTSHSDSLSKWGKEQLEKELKEIIESKFYDPVKKELEGISNKLSGKTSFTEDELGDIIHQTRIASLSGKSDLDNLDLKITSLTSKRLDPFSRHAKVAKDWGMKANEMMPEADIPTAESLRQTLQAEDLLDAVKSDDDPEGILFATRMCQEWHYARKDKTILPKTPQQHLAEEKSFAEFAVKWGQKQATRGVIYAVIEGGVDLAAGATVTLVKGTVKAGVKTTIASFKIPYKVHQIKTGVMPGEDYPYKVVQDVVNNRLKQLGFKAAMSFVPRPIKTAAGGAIVLSAYAHSAMVDPKDKIKTDSWLKTLAVEGGITGAIMPVSIATTAVTNKVMEAKLKQDLTNKHIPEQRQKLLQAYQDYTNGIKTQFEQMKQQFRDEMKDKLPEAVISEMIEAQDLAFKTDLAELQEQCRQKLSDSFDKDMQDLKSKGLIDSWDPLFTEEENAVLEGKINEDSQPADLVMNLIAKAYPNIDRGKEEYKEAVDASLAKIASTPFGRDLIESMAQQGIRITIPSDSAHTIEGEHDHQSSSGNYANPDNDTVFFDPSYKPSAEDVKDRPWLDCDPAIVLFHEMLHLYYSENPIQFEISGQTYQFGGKGDPISEHMVAGADYINEQGVEFRFSDPKWVKQHLKAGKYVNENDLRRALKQPIRERYYFDDRNTGADQARFYNENGEDDSFGRTLYVSMNALRSDTGFRLPKTGDFSNKEREVWDKLADDLPIKSSGQVGFSLSESRFIRDHSHLYSAEKLAHTIEYYHRNGLTPWYDNSARLDRDFYFRLSDITLDNGHVIESEDIQLYLELYGGPEKFVEDNVDSALGGKETLVVDMVAQRIDDIRTGQNSIASVSEDFFYRSFITDYFTKRNIKASTPVVGYHSEGHFREGNFHPHGHLTTGPNWKSDIQAFTAALESAGYTGPFKEVDFDETFYWYEGQHLRAYYDVEDLARNDHRDCIQRVEGVYVYRGAEDKDLIYVSGKIVEVPRGNGQQNTEIDMPPEVFKTLDGPVLMMGGDIKFILPRKKMETLMTVATRRDTASYTYQTSNVDYHTVQNSDVQTEFTEKLDSRFEGNNRRQIEETIERQLKYAPLMRIHSESDSDKEDIKKWLNEFSSGTRSGVFASHECVISDINSIQNPAVFYTPLSQDESTKYDGLMINWVRGEVIPIPRDLTQRLTLFKTPQFRSSFTESLSQSNIDRLLLKTGQYGTWSKMDNISGYLNELRSASPLDMDQKIEILNMCLDYVAMVAVGQKNPDDDETQALLDLFDYVRPDWGGKVINGLSRSEEADILYSSRMNNFVATMHLQTSYHSLEGREYSVDQFPNRLTDFLVDKLHKDFDYHVTSASEESTQRLIESLREPLRWSSYVLAVGLGAAFPGFAAGVIGGMVTTFLTDTVLDIVQLETEDSLEKRQELLEGIIAKCYTSLGAELGGAVLGPAAGKLVKWMTKTVSRKILGESSKEVMQMIDNIDLRTIQEKIDIERGVSSQNVIKTRWGRIRSRVKAENPTARARKSPITRELTEEQRTELLENQMSDTLRKYSTFDSIVDNTVKIRDVLKAAAILGVINELMLEVDKALDPNISGNAFYQIVKMWFVYSLAGASGEVLNIKTADDLLEEAMTKLDVPPQKRTEFLQKVRDERISKQRLLDDPQVQDAKAAMDSTDPVVSSTRELVGPDGRSNQEVDYYPENNWNDEANRLMRLLDNRDLTHMAPDIAEVPLAVGEDLTPREKGAIPKRQRKDGNRMQVQVDVHQQDTDL